MPNHISARKRQLKRPYAVRKPKEYVAKKPGDIVEVDTLDVRPLPGVMLKHFTARDVVSRWSFTWCEGWKPIAGQPLTLRLALSFTREGPPRSPKLNGHVERAQRAHTEEFYEVTDASPS